MFIEAALILVCCSWFTDPCVQLEVHLVVRVHQSLCAAGSVLLPVCIRRALICLVLLGTVTVIPGDYSITVLQSENTFSGDASVGPRSTQITVQGQSFQTTFLQVGAQLVTSGDSALLLFSSPCCPHHICACGVVNGQ